MRPSKSELEILTGKSKGRKRALIQVLLEVQDRFHRLPPEALEHIGDARTAAAAMDRRLREGPARKAGT